MSPRPTPDTAEGSDPNNPLSRAPVEFLGSFPHPNIRFEPPKPEIAIIGRSNVGKSSLLNALLGGRRLARVSATPGKTTLLNVYDLPRFRLVDLPGYGFARASKSARATYAKLVTGYLTKREPLAGVVWLLDARHAPSKDDFEMQDQLIAGQRAALIVMTKADKLNRSELRERLKAMSLSLGVKESELLPVSSVTGAGVTELAQSIAQFGKETP